MGCEGPGSPFLPTFLINSLPLRRNELPLLPRQRMVRFLVVLQGFAPRSITVGSTIGIHCAEMVKSRWDVVRVKGRDSGREVSVRLCLRGACIA